MKKLALVLGSLLIAATASAKEVVAAPVVVAEPVVVEEAVAPVEVPKFKASGWIQLGERYYGQEEKGNSASNYLRTRLEGAVNMTENDTLQFRVTSYDDFNGTGSDTPQKSEDTESRYRWVHKFGTIADSKVKFATRLELKQTDNYDKVEGQLRFDFADYVPDFKYYDTTLLTLAPKVFYTDLSGTNGANNDYSTGAGMDLYHLGQTNLGDLNIEWEYNMYYTHVEMGEGDYSIANGGNGTGTHKPTTGRTYKSGDNLAIEAYTYITYKLWNSEDNFYQVNAYLENGLDPYNVDFGRDNGAYTLYTWPELQLVMRLNPATKVTLGAGAYYENNQTNKDSAQDWEWQPMATAKIKTTF
ncbi:MAG: FomA family porin-like outer membrane protein [Fusobacteriaceae bacterium]